MSHPIVSPAPSIRSDIIDGSFTYRRKFRYPTNQNTIEENVTEEESQAFLRHLKLTFIVLRVSGFFPFVKDKILSAKNIFSFIIIGFIGGMNGYIMLIKFVPSLVAMFTHWSDKIAVEFGICLYFTLSFFCLVFLVTVGYFKKLEEFSQLMSLATNQKGMEVSYKPVSKVLRNIQIVLVFAACFNFIIYLCILAVEPVTELMPQAVNILKNLFGETLFPHLAELFFAPLDYVVLYQSALVYWTCCKCLRVEFEQLNKDIEECDLKNVPHLKVLALRQSRLLKCLHYLRNTVKLYAMFVIAIGSLISTLFMYVILLPDVDFGFRLLAGYWLLLIFAVNSILCLSAEGLHKSVGDTEDSACEKIAEDTANCDVDDMVYDVTEMICQQATVDVQITAFGFFTVSKELLLSIYSFILTYVVILLITPPSSGDITIAMNTTDIPLV